MLYFFSKKEFLKTLNAIFKHSNYMYTYNAFPENAIGIFLTIRYTVILKIQHISNLNFVLFYLF